MIGELPELQRLGPPERARLYFADASCELSNRLWSAALGSSQPFSIGSDALRGTFAPPLAALSRAPAAFVRAEPEPSAISAATIQPPDIEPSGAGSSSFSPAVLGPNHIHGGAIELAAARTGLPAAALAATIDAEAGKVAGGGWNVLSRNPRSSAAGLGQFLGKTWEGEAERHGTFLHAIAVGRGWLDSAGQLLPAARSALLALRYEPRVAIEAIADYARTNLDRLKAAGIRIEHGANAVAHAAYLAHHLGPGDVVRFLRGGIGDVRAAHLLAAQVGGAEAARRIATAGGGAGEAHRAWLLAFVDHHIRPDRFA